MRKKGKGQKRAHIEGPWTKPQGENVKGGRWVWVGRGK